jgi:hypothetical protein
MRASGSVRVGLRGARDVAACLIAVNLVAATLAATPGAIAQDDGRRQLALELARLVVDDASRRAMEDEITAGMVQGLTAMLQERLARRLLDSERQKLATITRSFVGETLGPGRTRELTADVYLRHFDAAELRELVRFQSSPVGLKAREMAPAIARETAQRVEREIETSPAAAGVLEDLRRLFPVLGAPESP